MKRLLNIEDTLSLKTFTTMFNGRMSAHLSPDKRWLAYSVYCRFHQGSDLGKTYRQTGMTPEMAASKIWLTNVESGESRNLTPGWGGSWGPRWSPDGQRLAFYSAKNGKVQLYVWHQERGEARSVCEEAVHIRAGHAVPQWTPDGSQIICRLQPEKLPTEATVRTISSDKGEDPKVQIREHIPETNKKQNEREINENRPPSPAWSEDRLMGDVAAVTVATGEVRRLTSGLCPLTIDVSPDGRFTAVLSFAGIESPATQQIINDLYLVPLHGGPPVCPARSIQQYYGVSWSPDGSSLAYIAGGSRESRGVFVASVADGSLHNLTEDIELKLRSTDRPLWSVDGKHLFCAAGEDLWSIAIDSGSVRNLTTGLKRRIAGVLCSSDGYVIWQRGNEWSVCIQTSDGESKKHGFYQIDLTNGAITQLMEENRLYGEAGSTIQSSQDVSRDSAVIAYVAEDAKHPADIWIADRTFRNRRRVTLLNPHLKNMTFGETRLISWQTNDGKDLAGAILLPPDYVPGRRYPLVTWLYGGSSLSNGLNRFGLRDAAVDNVQLLAAHGYAVLTPDAPLKTENPLQEIGEVVLPGVDKLIEMGIADEERLGLIGHSYGSYCVNCLITQTTRFRAAISLSGVSNLVSFYGAISKQSGHNTWGWAESGQGRMRGTLWEVPQRYIENSPVFYLDKVETPLLLIQGTEDFAPTQAEEMYSGLRRLDKRVTLAYYPGGHWHGTWSYENIVDYWQRIIAWFDELM